MEAVFCENKKPEEKSSGFSQRCKDSNLENDGVRVRCLTIWRQRYVLPFGQRMYYISGTKKNQALF